jgi:hypothetical protein
MTTLTINGLYGNGNEAEIFVYETEQGYWYAVEGSHNVNCTWDDAILEYGCNIEKLEDHDHFSWANSVDSEDDLKIAVADEDTETNYNTVIESFINGQFSQMCVQFGGLDASDFVQDLQDDNSLNDKQKISILGKLLKDNA